MTTKEITNNDQGFIVGAAPTETQYSPVKALIKLTAQKYDFRLDRAVAAMALMVGLETAEKRVTGYVVDTEQVLDELEKLAAAYRSLVTDVLFENLNKAKTTSSKDPA